MGLRVTFPVTVALLLAGPVVSAQSVRSGNPILPGWYAMTCTADTLRTPTQP